MNFAFITKNGKAQAPANPVNSTLATFTPSARELFMNSGDRIQVSLGDTRSGLRVRLHDLSTGRHRVHDGERRQRVRPGEVRPEWHVLPAIPYNFHPMYSTSSPQTRVPWAAHSFNIGFDSEIGHFQFCNGPVKIPATPFGLDSKGNPTACPTGDTEGRGASASAPDAEDLFCFPGKEALVFKVQGCTFTNTGFDGASYQRLWPDGNTAQHPTPFQVSSPRTGPGYSVQYQKAVFETDLPAIESTCNPVTGTGCTLIPQTDLNQPAAFYPFFSSTNTRHGCVWQFGNNIPGQISNFGQNAAVRLAAGPLLHPAGRQGRQLLPGFPQHPAEQPMPGTMTWPAVRAD